MLINQFKTVIRTRKKSKPGNGIENDGGQGREGLFDRSHLNEGKEVRMSQSEGIASEMGTLWVAVRMARRPACLNWEDGEAE